MEKQAIVENVVAAIDGIVEFVPKKWKGVRGLHLKLAESLPLPLYQALPDVKFRIEGIGSDKKEVIEDEGVEGKEIVVKKDENLGLKKKGKGMIHEVRYMDTVEEGDDVLGIGSESDGDIGEVESVSKKRKDVVKDDVVGGGKKKRKGDLVKKEEVKQRSKKELVKDGSGLIGIEESGKKLKKKGSDGTTLKMKKCKKQSAV